MQTKNDPRFTAFISPQAPDVFRSVLSTSDVWRPDPLDVPSIHAAARRTFDDVIEATRAHAADAYRRLILLQGVAGSGKTHLVSALRNDLHESLRGFFSYMQMQTSIADYSRYILLNVVSSLEKPMRVDFSPESCFERLSRGILAKALAAGLVKESADHEFSYDAYAVAEELKRQAVYSRDTDTQVLAALLLLQRHDVLEAEIVSRYLRCETLTSRDAKRVDFLASLDDPTRTLQQLARIIDETFGLPLVICLDQLDNFYNNEVEGGKRFQEATSALDALVNGDNGATIVVVVAILDDQYTLLRSALLQPQRDRYELGTAPVRLDGNASAEQIKAVLERRLGYLYEKAGARIDNRDPLFPYSHDTPQSLSGSRLRTALRALGEARMRSVGTGLPPAVSGTEHPPDDVPALELVLSERWNDASLTFSEPLPTNPGALLELLRFGIEAIAPELPVGFGASLELASDMSILERIRPHASDRELLSIADQAPQGGSLGKAVDALSAKAHERGSTAVLIRSADFPASPKTKIFQQLGSFLKAGNRRLTFAPGDWRTLAAYRAFSAEHRSRPSFDAWVLEAKPLTALPGMQALLELDEAVAPAPAAIAEPSAPEHGSPPRTSTTDGAPVATPSVVARRTDGSIVLGSDDQGRSAVIDPSSLTRHAAILGGSGSGKTTLAFAVLEGLLERGTPAILIDRKGDLCWLGDPDAWKRDVDAATAQRRKILLSKLAIDVYTPGANAGRNLAITALPSGLKDAKPDDRDEAARAAALALGAMLGYGNAKRDRLAILDRAIATLGALTDTLTLDGLIEFIDSQDEALIASIGRLRPKTLEAVASDLSVLKINAKRLLSPDAEPLNVERLLAIGSYAKLGKTQLSIISTKALGDGIDALFWISRLLVDLSGFASRNPKAQLQAVVFFDEADRYLPATSKPITKEPMENLLKRARSGGLGVLLATQSPGDLDYKSKENITTWLIGRVSEDRAREKLEGVLGNAKTVERLPQLKTGDFFMKNETGLTFFHGDLPIVVPRQLEEARIIDLGAKRW